MSDLWEEFGRRENPLSECFHEIERLRARIEELEKELDLYKQMAAINGWPDIVRCPTCNGDGWVIEEVSDE